MVSFTVDNFVYLLRPNGEIIKVYSGLRSQPGLPILKLDPPVLGAVKILTTPDDKNLYILDQVGKRIVVISKDGELINQYFSDKFDIMRDMAVDSANQRIYVANGNQIFQIDTK